MNKIDGYIDSGILIVKNVKKEMFQDKQFMII